MSRLRRLVSDINVGEYQFDIAVTRQMVYEEFKKNPILFESCKKISPDFSGGLDETMAILEFQEELPEFVENILPKMIAEADSKVDAKEFIAYCEENYVIDEVNNFVFQFAMQGFTGDKGVTQEEQKPKVTVKFQTR